MSVRCLTVPCWEITCDQCWDGDNFEYGGQLHHATEAEARESAESSDWKIYADGRTVCHGCRFYPDDEEGKP